MELSSIVGIVLAILGIGVGMVLKGVSPIALLNPAAALIIFAGTGAAVCNAFPMEHVKKWPILFKKVWKKQVVISKVELLRMFVELSQTARREGILALESKVSEIPDEFLKTGLNMVIDGLDPDFVGDVLDAEVKGMEERHRLGAALFSQAGMYAPTLGVLGAVIGLIAALGNLDDVEKLGHAIAAAFVATLFGIFTGYVICHPYANKLKMLSHAEVEVRKMMVEGILSLQAGDSPTAIEAKLTVFIPQRDRELLKAKTEE